MNIAEQLKSELNFNKIITQLQRELPTKDRVFISSTLAENNIQRLIDEGFQVYTDGQQYNGGIHVGFKQKNQWRD